MEQTAHLSDEQFTRYRSRAMAAPELLEADSHLAECDACRDRMYVLAQAGARIKAVRADIEGHLDYADIAACSEGRATEAQKLHLRDCAMCQSEVLDLSRFRTELEDTPRTVVAMPSRWAKLRMPLAIAAGVVLVAGGTVFMLRRQGPAPAPVVAEKRPELDKSLPPAEREVLQLAMANHRLERAPMLDKLISKPGKLLSGAPEAGTFELMGPIGTVTLMDRPLLRWGPMDGATQYVVSIFDENFEKIAESPALTSTDWRPDKPLPRERVLNWQVTAKTAKGSVHAPTPPAPEARFQVAPVAVAEEIDAARRQHPDNALLIAALCAHAGALDDAEEAMRAMDAGSSQPYRESVMKIRHPELGAQ